MLHNQSRTHRLLLVGVCIATLGPDEARAQVALTLTGSPARLLTVEVPSGTILNDVRIGVSGINAQWAYGLARRPGDGRVFTFVDASFLDCRLVGIDACTGVGGEVGTTGPFLQDLTFDASGTLWAVSDAGTEITFPDALFQVSMEDGAATLVSDLGASPDTGEGIAFDPLDGLLYRQSGFPHTPSQIFESINPGTLARREIAMSGDDLFMADGLTYLEGGSLLVAQNGFLTITTRGVVERLSSLPFLRTSAALVVEGGEPRGTTLVTVSVWDARLRRVDLESGRTLWCVPISMAGATVTGATGLAQNPADGRLFALLTVSGVETTRLATVDPLTGVARRIGDTGKFLEDIAFVGNASGATLYGVSADDAPVTPEWLFAIDPGDASLTPIMALGDGTDGESIAFNPLDGRVYHASGVGRPDVDRVFERVDVEARTVTDVPLSGAAFIEATAMAYLARGELVLADIAHRLYRITQSGEVTFIGNLDTGVSGMVLLRKGVGENTCRATVNSTGAPARMSAFGSDRAVVGSELTLTAEPVPDQVGLFFYGPTEIEVPFGNGYLCVGGGVTRVFPPVRAIGRSVSTVLDAGAFVPGETVYFQYWFRDPSAGGAAFNTSDALRVTFKF